MSDELVQLNLSRSCCEILLSHAPSVEEMQANVETWKDDTGTYGTYLVAALSLRLQLEEALA